MTQDPQSASNGVVGYELETPFLLDPRATSEVVGESPVSAARAFAPAHEIQTPFLTEYFHETGERGISPLAEPYASLIAELYDREFEEALLDLTHEASALAEEHFSFETGDAAAERVEAETGLREHFVPLIMECESLVDRLSAEVAGHDVLTMSEEDLETLLDRFAPGVTGLPPVQEQFLGGFFNKVKKAVKGAASLAKKGLTAISKLTPVGLILGRLKALVRPLLERVLRFAVDKLPVALRPAARQLARQLLGVAIEVNPVEPPDGNEPAAADPATIQQDTDGLLAGYILQGEEFEQRAAVEELLAGSETVERDRLRELTRARVRFCRQMARLHEAEDAGPAVQEFVPAILAALKIGIGVVGRPRVVSFLGGLVARMISQYVGPEQARALGSALVDAGLRTVSLEVAGEDSAAAEALAATVEDTVNRVAMSAPEEAWSSEALLEGHVREAFERSAAAHFPDQLLRPAVRESTGLSGAWVALPSGPTKHYKKYSRVVEITVTPQMAAALKTFRGHALHHLLRDQLGVAPHAPVTGRLHLYEAIAGTTLADVARHEKHVRGLGTTRREAWSLFHPLSPEAAGILLREPGLGRAFPASATADHAQVAVGQRFYYLELPSVQTRFGSAGAAGAHRPRARRPAHISQARLAFAFPQHELRLSLYFSESEAQEIARHVRRKAPPSVVLGRLQAGLIERLEAVLSGQHAHGIRVVHEMTPSGSEGRRRLMPLLQLAGRQLAKLLARWTAEAFRREAEARFEALGARMVRAADAEADGLTLTLVFQRPSFFAPLRRLLATQGPVSPAIARDLVLDSSATADVQIGIHPGYADH